jgi:hypothetical protein
MPAILQIHPFCQREAARVTFLLNFNAGLADRLFAFEVGTGFQEHGPAHGALANDADFVIIGGETDCHRGQPAKEHGLRFHIFSARLSAETFAESMQSNGLDFEKTKAAKVPQRS